MFQTFVLFIVFVLALPFYFVDKRYKNKSCCDICPFQDSYKGINAKELIDTKEGKDEAKEFIKSMNGWERSHNIAHIILERILKGF